MSTQIQVETSSGGPTQTVGVVTDPPSSIPLLVLQATPRAMIQLGWDCQSPSLPQVLAPAGHRPGIYHVSAPLVVRVTQGAGIINWAVTFNAPGLGPAELDQPASLLLTATGVLNEDVLELVSDGTAPIVWQGTPFGATGPVLVDVYAAAFLMGLIE